MTLITPCGLVKMRAVDLVAGLTNLCWMKELLLESLSAMIDKITIVSTFHSYARKGKSLSLLTPLLIAILSLGKPFWDEPTFKHGKIDA